MKLSLVQRLRAFGLGLFYSSWVDKGWNMITTDAAYNTDLFKKLDNKSDS